MINIVTRITSAADIAEQLTLTWEKRQKFRFRAISDDGEEVGVFLERGKALAEGDLLQSDDGRVFRVRAASEDLSAASTDNSHDFARACYHLGNRHTPVEITGKHIFYPPDHVLDEMLRQLGLMVRRTEAAFHPETGAYSHGAGYLHHHP